jgi:hypothetical protein
MSSLYAKEKIVNPAMDIPLRKGRGSEEIRITPELAQHWLTFNTSNRELTAAKIEQFRADMERGYWNDDGATIRFAYGKLLDGQHRLKALLLAGVTLRMLVVFGLDSEVQVTIDTGRSRTPRDILSIEGLEPWSARTLGSAIHAIIAYEGGMPMYSPKVFTNRDVRNYYLENRGRLDATVYAINTFPRRHPTIPFARLMVLHYIFSKRDRDAAERFFDAFVYGAGLLKTSPIYHLRERLTNDLLDGKTKSAYDQYHYFVKTWNNFRAKGIINNKTFLYPHDGESFPEIAL